MIGKYINELDYIIRNFRGDHSILECLLDEYLRVTGVL